jgi:hypothetical protein
LLSSSPSLSSPQPQQQQQPQQQHFGTATLSSGLTASGGASAETTLNLDIIDELVDPDLQQFASESRFHSAAGSPDKSAAATSTGSQPPASPSKYPSSTGDDELDEILNM